MERETPLRVFPLNLKGFRVFPKGKHPFRVFPLEQTRHVGVAKSERPRLTNGEIILSNLCDDKSPTLQTDRQTDIQTDRQTTCDRNTALCTEVHRAVKSSWEWLIIKCDTFYDHVVLYLPTISSTVED